MLAVALGGAISSEPVAGQVSTDPRPEKLFGGLTRLDRLLTRAIDKVEKGEDIRVLIHQIQDGKLAIVDSEFSAPVDGVKGSSWFRLLDAVDSSLVFALQIDQGNVDVHTAFSFSHAAANKRAMLGALNNATRLKQSLEASLHNANQALPNRTAMGSLSNGLGGALAYAIKTNTAANAFKLTLPGGTSFNGML